MIGQRIHRAVGVAFAATLGSCAGLIYCHGWMVG